MRKFCIILVVYLTFSCPIWGDPNNFSAGPRDIQPLLEPIRTQYNLPALAAVVIHKGGIEAVGATGFRKIDSDIKATSHDQFHIGSCTKAMTATLVGMLIENEKLQWDMTLAEAFPDMAKNMHPDYHNVTLEHLLAHRAGLHPSDQSWPKGKSFNDLHKLPGSPMQQRLEYTRMMLRQPPVAKPGTKYIYSNAGYAIAGVMAEQAMNKPWETLMQEMLFGPLNMKTAGFGAMGSPGKIDQPWQHKTVNFLIIQKHVAVEPGRFSDNPPVIGPAGTVHCSIEDWAHFIAIHLQGEREDTKLLKKETFQQLHTPAFDGDYAAGWLVTKRDWAGGTARTHAGSYGMNFAVVWLAPHRNFAVLVASNQGGGKVEQACDDTAGLLIEHFLLNKN